MSAHATSRRNTIVLFEGGGDSPVMVIPRDEDKFCVTVEEAVKACRMVDAGYSFVRQVAELREVLANWIDSRRESIQSAYISFREAGILFVVAQTGTARDNNLADQLSDLDIEIANDERFDLLNVDVLSLPRCSQDSMTAFLASGNVATYAGEK